MAIPWRLSHEKIPILAILMYSYPNRLTFSDSCWPCIRIFLVTGNVHGNQVRYEKRQPGSEVCMYPHPSMHEITVIP